MKHLWFPLVVGAIGSYLLLKYVRKESPALKLAPRSADDLSLKNFGAFPIDIPEKQFDELFL